MAGCGVVVECGFEGHVLMRILRIWYWEVRLEGYRYSRASKPRLGMHGGIRSTPLDGGERSPLPVPSRYATEEQAHHPLL